MTDAQATVPANADVPENTGEPDGYGQALEELEELLDELEDADIDVDHLATRVARGVELVRFCRERLAVVTADVDQVVADLQTDQADSADGNSDTNGADTPDNDESSDG